MKKTEEKENYSFSRWQGNSDRRKLMREPVNEKVASGVPVPVSSDLTTMHLDSFCWFCILTSYVLGMFIKLSAATVEGKKIKNI